MIGVSQNTYYLNSTSGTCYNWETNTSTTCNFSGTGLKQSGRDLIDNALYYLGGSSTIELYPHQFYDNEHGEAVYGCSSDSCGGTRETKWVGRVGVMYSSDYTYATDLSICQKTGNYYNDLSCKDSNWLYLEVDEWTIAPRSDTGAHMVIVDSSGYVGLNGWEFCFAYHAGEVLPVVYLKSDVVIGLGEGTSEKPYTLVTK